MTVWILVSVLLLKGGSAQLVMQEFNSLDACRLVRDALRDDTRLWYQATGHSLRVECYSKDGAAVAK